MRFTLAGEEDSPLAAGGRKGRFHRVRTEDQERGGDGVGWSLQKTQGPRPVQILFGPKPTECKAEKLLNLSTDGKEIRKQRKVSCEVTNTPYSFDSVRDLRTQREAGLGERPLPQSPARSKVLGLRAPGMQKPFRPRPPSGLRRPGSGALRLPTPTNPLSPTQPRPAGGRSRGPPAPPPEEDPERRAGPRPRGLRLGQRLQWRAEPRPTRPGAPWPLGCRLPRAGEARPAVGAGRLPARAARAWALGLEGFPGALLGPPCPSRHGSRSSCQWR